MRPATLNRVPEEYKKLRLYAGGTISIPERKLLQLDPDAPLAQAEEAHSFELGWISLFKVSDETTFRERVTVEHCRKNKYHFSYSIESVAKRGGQIRAMEYDDDVVKFFNVLSGKRNFEFYVRCILPPLMGVPEGLKDMKFQKFSICGFRLVAQDRCGMPELHLNWQEDRMERVLSFTGSFSLDASWPSRVYAEAAQILATFAEEGFPYASISAI